MERHDKLLELAQTDPVALRDLLRRLDGKVVRPHSGQRLVIDSNARFKVMNCGRRWGKTVIAAKMFIRKSRKPNQVLWWVAPTYKVVKRGYSQVLKQLPDGVLLHDPPPETHFDAGRSVVLRFKNGTKMEFYSAERPQGMLGEGVDYAVLDEAAIMPGAIWNQYIRPTLMDNKGGALMISTPRGRNWFYKVWLMGRDNDLPDWESWTFTSYDNPALPEGEVEEMRKAMPRMEFDQEVLAKFLASGSSVFMLPDGCLQKSILLDQDAGEHAYFIHGVMPQGHVVLGIDLAKANDWTVIYGARARDRRNCYFERMQAITWPEQKRRIRRAVQSLIRGGATGVTLVMDSTGVGDPIVDDMEEAGYDVIGINFSRYKNNMVRLLAKDLEEQRAFILEDGQSVEFENYAMTLSRSERITYSAPEGEHDDVVSAKMLQHWGIVNEGVPDATVISGTSPVEAQDEVEDFSEPDGYEDLLDLHEEMTDEDALGAIGLGDSGQGRTIGELLNDPNVWH